MEKSQYYRTKADAVAHVPSHVVPKDCFVWDDGPTETPWRVIPGTGCAHWVAHQLGLNGSGAACCDGYLVRVIDIIAGMEEHSMDEVHVGDVWVQNDLGHCGIVRAVASERVNVQHDSSSQGGVVTSWFTSGGFYRR